MANVRTKGLNKALKAAIHGPSKKKIKWYKHPFNVKAVQVKRKGRRIFVNGNKGHHLSHRLKWRPDNQIFFEFEISPTGQIENLEVKISKGSDKLIGWIKQGLKIADFVKDIFNKLDEGGVDAQMAGKADGAAGDIGAIVKKAAAGRASDLLDGSWRGDAMFMIASVALMYIAEQALVARSNAAGGFAARPRITAAALAAA
ncbi:MAG: hypothetical protein AB8F65_15050 [Woeseiaceae bacterium]